MGAVIYTRFSPRPNADESESCENQRNICTELALQKGWPVLAVFEDPDRSGTDWYREKLHEAISTLKKGDILLVYKWDRIARDLMLSLQYERQIESKGAKVVAVTGDVPGDNPQAKFTRHILMAVAELERQMISERTRDAMRILQKRGMRMTRKSTVPYGWRADPNDEKRMVPDERELAIIDTIVENRKGGMSLRGIIKLLDERGMHARNGSWTPKVVRAICIRAGV